MLKGIPEILSPELLKVLDEMGHGERIVISDGNFPAHSVGKNAIIIRADGHGVPEILDAVLKLMPLDTYVENPVTLMKVTPGDPVRTPIWDQYKEIIARHDARGSRTIGTLERFTFYKEASEAYAVVVTGEKALYANVMLQKGVVTD
ncbi:MAG: fucose isomerase [Lachnospiraceae bacterium]|nr:fucose isomerase [Lachnospiraceae bacterium]